MPMYTVSSLYTLDHQQRQMLADCITRLHCGHTGAPPAFVTVVFASGIPLRAKAALHVFGNVRHGRSPELNERLASALQAGIEAIGLMSGMVLVELFEVAARWVMEYGAIIPEPGDEAGWLDAHLSG